MIRRPVLPGHTGRRDGDWRQAAPGRRDHGARAARLAGAGLLALLLLWATAWGAWHRTAHALPEPGAPLQVVAASDADAPAGADHRAGSAECRLIDHLMGGEALTSPDLSWPVLPALQPPPADPPPGLACRPLRLVYQARAPPQV